MGCQRPSRSRARFAAASALTFACRYAYVKSPRSRPQRDVSYRINSEGRVRACSPSRSSTPSARSAIAIWPNAVGWTWSAISTRRPRKPARSTTKVPVARAQPSPIALASRTFAPARGRPRASGIGAGGAEAERDGRVERALAAPVRDAERVAEDALVGERVPVEAADVVRADVE